MGKKGYVNNKQFRQYLIEYNEYELMLNKIKSVNGVKCEEYDYVLKKQNRVKNEIGKIFVRICQGLLKKPNFINYSWDRKDDMLSDACYYMSRFIHKFDTTKDNPFSYFTQACFNAYRQNINKCKKNSNMFQPLGYIEQIFVKNNQGSSDEWSE
jgi:hypothetical protein